MPTATIIYERTEMVDDGEGNQTEQVVAVTMTHWPPTTWLVHLDTPLQMFDPETGAPTNHEYIALCCKDSEPRESYVFPTNERGDFVDPSMTPMRRRDYGLPHSVLSQLGYQVVN